MTTIHVYLLDEGTDVWRPVRAIDCGDGTFEIPADTKVPDDETWEFGPGSTVQCGMVTTASGDELFAAMKLA